MKHTTKCPQCDSVMTTEIKKSFPYLSSAGVTHVPNMKVIACSRCDEIIISDEEVKRAENLIAKKKITKGL